MEKKTNYQIKTVYLIGIIMVLIGHIFTDGGIPVIITYFPTEGISLGIFMFCSGYLYKKESEEHWIRYILKKILTLLVPYFIYNLIYGLIALLLRNSGFSFGEAITLKSLLITPILNGHQFIYNLGGWFVFPLFIVLFINILLRKGLSLTKAKIPEWVYFVIYLLVGIAGIYLTLHVNKTEWMLVLLRVMYFFPFFGFGRLYQSNLEARLDKISGYLYFLPLIFIRFIIVRIYGHTPTYRIAWMSEFTNCLFMPCLVGISGCLIIMRVARYLSPLMKKSRLLSEMASSTYSIMINHLLAFMLVKFIFSLIFKDFSIYNFKHNIWYYYYPGGYKIFSIIYILMGLLLPAGFSFAFRKMKGLIMSKITNLNKTYYPYGDKIKEYLLKDVANVKDYNSISDARKPFKIEWHNVPDGASSLRLIYGLKPDFTDAKIIELDVKQTSYDLYNLFKSSKYYVKVVASFTGKDKLLFSTSFKTTDLGPRVMDVDGVDNVRDLGGYMTESGKCTLQGISYRSGALLLSTDKAYTNEITEIGKRVMSEEMGIKTEFDLRTSDENQVKDVKTSIIPGANLIYFALNGYLCAFSETVQYKNFFKALARKENYPFVVHCTGGADRTGTACFLFNGLLGVSKKDLIHDYEFSTFSIYGERNSRPGTTYDFAKFLNKLESDYSGDTLSKKIENYLLSIGVTQIEIDAIKAINFGDNSLIK